MSKLDALRTAAESLSQAAKQFGVWKQSSEREIDASETTEIFDLKSQILEALHRVFCDYTEIKEDAKLPDFLSDDMVNLAFLDIRIANIALDAKGELHVKFGQRPFNEMISGVGRLQELANEHNRVGILADTANPGKILLDGIGEILNDESLGTTSIAVVK